MKDLYLLFIAFLFFQIDTLAQAPDMLWTKTYKGIGSAEGHSVQQTSDGGYIVTGSSWNSARHDVYLMKTDSSGDTLWTKYFSDQFYASPIIADEKVWLLDRTGMMHIINAGPEYQLVAESPLGEPSDCTPAFSDKNIYIRTRNNLFCISAN